MSDIVKTYRLTKEFNGKKAVSDISLHIRQGEIYGFLGPNGAGKTTVMRLISNLIKPTSGEIEIFGEKLTETSYEVFKRMGSIIEYPVFYEKLTARENLSLHCEYMGYYNKKAIDEALELVNLRDIDKKPVKHFSLGMKQRLGIARAISTKPEFLMLDEPINGLDPVGIKEIRDLFRALSREYGITLFISSHILGEIEQIADTIGIINNGRLSEQVAMSSIQDNLKEYIEITTKDYKKAAYLFENKLGITNFRIIDGSILRIYDPKLSQGDIFKALILEGIVIDAISRKSSSLEEYFLNSLERSGFHDEYYKT